MAVLPRLRRVLAAGLVALAAAGCGERGPPDDHLPAPTPEVARLAAADEALANVHLPPLDPATMEEAEIRKVVGGGPRCDFRYTGAGRPVLAFQIQADGTPADAVAKLNGRLIPLKAAAAAMSARAFTEVTVASGPLRMELRPDKAVPTEVRAGVQRRSADLVFEVGDKLSVGYRGYVDCATEPPTAEPRH